MVDQKELEVWLNTRSREDAILIAQRAALRAFPVWSSQMGKEWARDHDLTCSVVLRCYLISGVACKYPTHKVKATAYAAASAYAAAEAASVKTTTYSKAAAYASASASATASAYAYASAATSSAKAVAASAKAASADMWTNVEQDIAWLRLGQDLFSAPLWHSELPADFLRAEAEGLEQLARETGVRNSFWYRWYAAAKRGEWLNWGLQREIALIHDGIWQRGPKAVVAAIAEIEAGYALALTDNAETIEPDLETGRFILLPNSVLPSDLGHYSRRKILKAVALVDDPACLQMYGGLSADLVMLRDAVADAANMPVELYDACASATRRLAVRAANGECPSPDKDAVLSDYLTRLRDVAVDILSHDPATQSVLDRRNAITGNDALIDFGTAVQHATAEVVPVTAGHLAKSLPKDAVLATDPTATPEDRKAAAFRLASRFLRIGKWVGGAVAGAGASVVLAKEVVEALPIIQASPYYQQVMAAILRWLGLG